MTQGVSLIKEGQCCGECIQTHCLFNNQTYKPGDVWRSEDNCLFYECAEILDEENVGVKVSSYKKACPELENCPPDQVVVRDCCPTCESIQMEANEVDGNFFTNHDVTMSKDTYRNHPCRRECVENAPPKTCNYKFVVGFDNSLIYLFPF